MECSMELVVILEEVLLPAEKSRECLFCYVKSRTSNIILVVSDQGRTWIT
jgi:hypothetical protein